MCRNYSREQVCNSGEQLIFSISGLLKSRIRNYGRMFERRVVFSIGVTCDTSPEKLKRIPEIIRKAIKAGDKTRFDAPIS
jgi:small-conductance mechanosensitive channel